jgi:tRNA A-37 threonylcarbamoyl transferase component Bud32
VAAGFVRTESRVLTLVKDRYEVLATLGFGGEAQIVKALDRQHGRFVALKIRPAHDEATRDALLGEARILLALPPHPALPLVREDFFDRGDYVVAMDWVEGTNLAKLLGDRGRPGLAPSSVLGYLAQAAEALTFLHTQSPPVIHGDVKPGNLILTAGGRIKLVDFGLSSAPGAPGRRAGTVGFRAPELAAGGSPSRASDVYAVAATAFALLTGSAPAGVLPAWEGIAPAQAEQLEAAIRRGMATDPARRPATPGELVERMRAGWTAALPTGVVTFCTSDIPGWTALWEAQPEAMAEALVRHDELIAEAVEAPWRQRGAHDGGGRRDGVGVRLGAARRGGCSRREPRARGRGVACRCWLRRALGAAHRRGRAARDGLCRAGPQHRGRRSRTGRRRSGLPVVGHVRSRRRASAGGLLAGRRRPSPAA